MPGGDESTHVSATHNITMPTVTTLQVTVNDANGAPVEGAQVVQNIDQNAPATGWPGGPSGTARLQSLGTAQCKTDKIGRASCRERVETTMDQRLIKVI